MKMHESYSEKETKSSPAVNGRKVGENVMSRTMMVIMCGEKAGEKGLGMRIPTGVCISGD